MVLWTYACALKILWELIFRRRDEIYGIEITDRMKMHLFESIQLVTLNSHIHKTEHTNIHVVEWNEHKYESNVFFFLPTFEYVPTKIC